MPPHAYIEVELPSGGKGGSGSGARGAGAWARDPAVRKAAWTGLMIATWYVLSTTLGMFNKVVVGKDRGVMGRGAFPAPLFMSGVQFLCQAGLAKLVFAAGLHARSAAPMGRREWARLVLPNGAITGLDIGLSNTSLVFITMSFYTMCKSTTPIFLMLFAFCWGLETPSWGLAGVVAVIVTGLLLLVRGEAKFDATGFALVMSAACMSGLRFTLTQVLLHGRGGAGGGGSGGGGSAHSPFGGPLEVLEALTPVMAGTTLLLSLATERLWGALPGSPYFDGPTAAAGTGLMIGVGALIAFGMVWAEYEVIKQTSALTFMIAGIVKEILTVVAAVAAFGDPFTPLNGLGLALTICGVALFNLYKIRRLRAAAADDAVAVRRPGSGPPPGGGGGGGGGGGCGGGGGPGGGELGLAAGAGGDAPGGGSFAGGALGAKGAGALHVAAGGLAARGASASAAWRRDAGGGSGGLDRHFSSSASGDEEGGGGGGGGEQLPLLAGVGGGMRPLSCSPRAAQR